jgi:hypothetical protein
MRYLEGRRGRYVLTTAESLQAFQLVYGLKQVAIDAGLVSEDAIEGDDVVQTVYTSRSFKGVVGHGDADPSNVSAFVRGAEKRVDRESGHESGPFARLTGSVSAPPKSSDPLPRRILGVDRKSCHDNLPTEIIVDPKFPPLGC